MASLKTHVGRGGEGAVQEEAVELETEIGSSVSPSKLCLQVVSIGPKHRILVAQTIETKLPAPLP